MPRSSHSGPLLKNDRATASVSAALALVLNELAQLLTLCGITPGEFVRVAKRSFVIAAAQHAKMRNGRVNASRIAALTGLTRAEVRQLLNPKSPNKPITVRSRVLRVVDGWLSDVDFLSEDGKPRVLSLDGQGEGFKELVRRYSGDIPAKAMRAELQQSEDLQGQGNFHTTPRRSRYPSFASGRRGSQAWRLGDSDHTIGEQDRSRGEPAGHADGASDHRWEDRVPAHAEAFEGHSWDDGSGASVARSAASA